MPKGGAPFSLHERTKEHLPGASPEKRLKNIQEVLSMIVEELT